MILSVSCAFKFEEMNSELEENQELADNRLIELQKLQQDLQTVHQENNNTKVDFRFECFIWRITNLCIKFKIMIAKPEGFIIMDYKTKLQTPATYFIQLKCYVLEGYSNHWFDIFDEQKCLLVQVNEVHFCLSLFLSDGVVESSGGHGERDI